jgi:inorganic pyrophosphatase
MKKQDNSDFRFELMGMLYRAHPWHGIPLGDAAPERLNCYVEIVTTDTVKYELDKTTVLLKVDRPQKFSNCCPALYGFVPQTYCAKRIGDYCAEKSQRSSIQGDGDPLDICIFAERPIVRGDLIVKAIPIGGFRMIDGEDADDKIIAVQEDDLVYGNIRDIYDCPNALIDRLRHYFLTYKDCPTQEGTETTWHHTMELIATYGREEAHHVIELARQDYQDSYGHLHVKN